jgi:ketosteroid isomerase-like protein
MSVEATTKFDLAAFKRCYEEWDVEGLLDLYRDDVEVVQISRDNPPSEPRVRQGKAALEGMFNHCRAAGVIASVENTVLGENRAAATVSCRFPGGRTVTANTVLDIKDGRIAREHEVIAGDAAA